MKHTSRLFIIWVISLLSLNSYAEECFLTVQEYIPEAGCSMDLKEYPSFEAKDWQACFNVAQKLAEQVGYESRTRFEGIDKLECRRTYTGNTTPKRTVLWQFKDSYIPLMSSHGILNTETSKFLTTPAKGDQAFGVDGEKLF